MTALKKSHLYRLVKTSQQGLETLYLFEVWNLSLEKDDFAKISQSPLVFTTNKFLDFTGTTLKVADHCEMLYPNLILPPVVYPIGEVRVSMSALVHIHYQNKSCFLIENGKVKPFGGAYQFLSLPPFQTLKLEDPNSLDLRFLVDSKELRAVERWFNQQVDRELDPLRELREELTEENPILTPEELRQILAKL